MEYELKFEINLTRKVELKSKLIFILHGESKRRKRKKEKRKRETKRLNDKEFKSYLEIRPKVT